MKLITEGNIKPYYVQMLVMLWYPGEKFAEDDDGKRYLEVKVSENSIALSCRIDEGEGSLTLPLEAGDTSELAVGRGMYKLFGSLTGFYPEWGIMTGVRPAKIPSAVLKAGGSRSDAAARMRERYLVKEDKADMAAGIAELELSIINTLPENSCSIYLSIPFCPTRCEYCSFVSYSTPRLLSLIPAYLEKLVSDLEALTDSIIRAKKKISTVYIGGGTPTILDAAQLDFLLDAVNRCLDRAGREHLREFTLEGGRPDTITEEKLAAACRGGITRISVNPQTTNNDVLQGIGRSHKYEDFLRSYDIAAKSGIKYINCDLIAGLPGDSPESFMKSVSDVASLGPANITIHTFAVKKSAAILERNPGIYSRGGGELSHSVSDSRIYLAGLGYNPYYIYRQKNTAGALENIGYAKVGAEGLYNIFIMEEVHDIFAVGAGAVTKLVRHGKDGEEYIERLFSPKYPYEYLEKEKFDIKKITDAVDVFYSKD